MNHRLSQIAVLLTIFLLVSLFFSGCMSAKQREELEEQRQKYIDIGYKDGYSDGYEKGYKDGSSYSYESYDDGYRDGYARGGNDFIEFLLENPDEILYLLEESQK